MHANKPTLWTPIVMLALRNLGGTAHLSDLYREVERLCRLPGSNRQLTTYWKDKVRQRVQTLPNVEHVGKGVWRVPGGAIRSGGPGATPPTP